MIYARTPAAHTDEYLSPYATHAVLGNQGRKEVQIWLVVVEGDASLQDYPGFLDKGRVLVLYHGNEGKKGES